LFILSLKKKYLHCELHFLGISKYVSSLAVFEVIMRVTK